VLVEHGTESAATGVLDDHETGPAALTIVYNTTPVPQSTFVAELAGTRQTLHAVQSAGTDPVVRQPRFAEGTFTVPAYTVAVFVQR
jgi:hypothetical protein